MRSSSSKRPLFCLLLLLLWNKGVHGSEPVHRPNIILILADDMGYADIGVHGCKDIPTPNIDRIAARGMRFTDAYSNGAFCTPTRAALLSGQYPHRFGNEDLTNVTGPLPKSIDTLADRLRSAGYATAAVGKWHLGADAGYTPLDRGFDQFFGFLGGGHNYLPDNQARGEYAAPLFRGREPLQEQRYLTDAFGEEAAEFVTNQQKEKKPFFLYLAFNAVHTPMHAPQKYLDRFASIDDPHRRTYAAMLSAMDDAIGQVIEKLEASGKLASTLVIFNNDNGGPPAKNGSRNTPLRGAKAGTYEGGIRVPLLMQWPDVLKARTTFSKPVITMDLTATMLAIAGADAKNIDGVDLLPFMTDKQPGIPHEALFWRCRTRGNNRAVRQGDWKYVYSLPGVIKSESPEEPAKEMLFNLADDPSEQRDLSSKNPEKLAELRMKFDAWSAAVDADCRKLGIEPPKAKP